MFEYSISLYFFEAYLDITMKNRLILVLGSVLSLGLYNTTMGQSPNSHRESIPQFPVEDFFRNPDKSSYQISPNGEFYSFLAPFESRKNIYVQHIQTGEARRITAQTDRDIAGYYWANDEKIIFMRDDGGDENWYLVAVNVITGDEMPLTKEEGVRSQIIDDLEDNPEEIIVGLNKRNPQIFDPYRLNIQTGELTMIAENPGNVTGWMTDHDGKLRIAITTDGVNTSMLHRATEESEWETVVTTNFKESVSPMFFTFDNKNLYANSNLGRDKSAAVIFDLAKRKETEVLFEDSSNDIDGLSYSRKRKVITSAYYTADKSRRHFFDEQSRQTYERLERELPGYEIAITSRTKSEDKFIVRTYSDRSLGAYYLYDVNFNTLKHVGDISPWLDENMMAPMQPIKYRSRDGLIIHGYLTIPVGLEGQKNLPVVVNVHGGPWARDNWGFNPEVQFLANRGFAVLQMNFRGSTSYGREFWEASFDQWGLKMQEDVQDGALWLIDQGIADPKRIAIYGGSYGGYATLQGLVKDPDFYACGVDYVGVSNLFTFMEGIPPYWKPYLEMMYEMVGDPNNEEDKKRMTATSPALNANKIKAPLFVAQGANDPRVIKSESDQMVEAMKKRGIEVQYMVKDNEGHGFHNEENKFEFYQEMEKFLNKHIGANYAIPPSDR